MHLSTWAWKRSITIGRHHNRHLALESPIRIYRAKLTSKAQDDFALGTLILNMLPEFSHPRQRRSLSSYLTDPKEQKILSAWSDVTSADAWLGERAYEIADHLRGTSDARWVTIGDGRFGMDSLRLRAHGAWNVLATDIDETLLKFAKADGRLSEYRVEDAEDLSFGSGYFDYVFCKEVLSECLRPVRAIYETLRVARKGVILIEPNDRIHSPALMAKSLHRRMMARDAPARENGSELFSISAREIEKIAAAIRLPQLAFKGLNDAYEPGLEFVPSSSLRGRRMKRKIAFRDMLCRLRLDEPMFLMAALFHVPATPLQRANMEKSGWGFVDSPRHVTTNNTTAMSGRWPAVRAHTAAP